jgi:hypothetical protein
VTPQQCQAHRRPYTAYNSMLHHVVRSTPSTLSSGAVCVQHFVEMMWTKITNGEERRALKASLVTSADAWPAASELV